MGRSTADSGEPIDGRCDGERRLACAEGGGSLSTARYRSRQRSPRPSEPAAAHRPCPRLPWRWSDHAVEGITFMLVAVVALALVFDYINGFHDTANAIATSVATRALHPRQPSRWRRRSTSSAHLPGRQSPRRSDRGWSTSETTTQAVDRRGAHRRHRLEPVDVVLRPAQLEQPCPDRRPVRGDAGRGRARARSTSTASSTRSSSRW